jgi:hypothetical protein
MIMETRPYMRARWGYAMVLDMLGWKKAALDEFQALLALNPHDNQGNRHQIARLLLGFDRDSEVEALLDQYPDESSAEFLYTRALLEFRKAGASQAASDALRAALEENVHVPAYLSGVKPVPAKLPGMIQWGGESEAAEYAFGYQRFWRRTRGALDWLKEAAGSGAAPAPKKKTKRGRRSSGKR